jgi:glucosamine--fructose-6-phosphate aminotransferase (isomerizing)
MCGIVGYIGKDDALAVLLDGLKRLEYRGYDSAGIAVVVNGKMKVVRAQGKLRDLERQLLNRQLYTSTYGVGHTRWATHGKPSTENAHPHCSGPIALVHNGIIENYLELRERLERLGYAFSSETDTETIAHLIEHHYQGDLFEAVTKARKELVGSYALAVISKEEPDVLVGVRCDSPLIVGIGEDEFFLASDIPAVLPYTRKMVLLENHQSVRIDRNGVKLFNKDGQEIPPKISVIEWSPAVAEKSGYKHFMLKEIFEQPRAISDTLKGTYSLEEGRVFLPSAGLEEMEEIEGIKIVACGTSWHAGLIGKYLIERWAKIPTEAEIASEFRYREPLINKKTLVICISQSGETADTLAALRLSKAHGARTLAVANVVGSSIVRESEGVIYTHAGPEIGVASTKAFTTQIIVMTLLAIFLGSKRGTLTPSKVKRLLTSLLQLPRLVKEALGTNSVVEEMAHAYMKKEHFLYLGRGIAYPLALEGALKLKEISYIHAEGYPAGEMKHGPIALIDENMPVVVVAPQGGVLEKTLGNMEEVRSRGGTLIAIAQKGNEKVKKVAHQVLEMPEVEEELAPAIYSVPLQLLAYHIADKKGCDVDQPRNLAKSVTVE